MEAKKENKLKTLFEVVGITLLYMLIQLAVSIVFSIVIIMTVPSADTDKEAVLNRANELQPVMVLISNVISVILFGIWYYRGYVRKTKLEGTYEPWQKKICDAKVIAFIVFSTLTIGLIDGQIADFMVAHGSVDLLSQTFSAFVEMTPINIISMVLLSSVNVALVFFGIILQKMKKSFGMAGCIIIPAILFAISMIYPVQMVYGIPFGLFMMFVSYKFNSIVPGMLMVMINNAGAMILKSIFSDGVPPAAKVFIVVFLALSIIIYRKLPFSYGDTKGIQ